MLSSIAEEPAVRNYGRYGGKALRMGTYLAQLSIYSSRTRSDFWVGLKKAWLAGALAIDDKAVDSSDDVRHCALGTHRCTCFAS